MKSLKKLLTIVMAMAMMFAFASTAMAADLAPGFYVNGVKQDGITIKTGDTVYTLVQEYLEANPSITAKWTTTTVDPKYSPLPAGSEAYILESMDGNGTVGYNSPVLEEYEYYDSDVDDPVLAQADKALKEKFPDSDGLGLWMGNGTGFSNDGPYAVYVGYAWTFTVNGSRPGIEITPDAEHPYNFFEYYMNEAFVKPGDIVELKYDLNIEPYEY